LQDDGIFSFASALKSISPDIAALLHSVLSSSTLTP